MADALDPFRAHYLAGAGSIDETIDPRDEMFSVATDRLGVAKATMAYLKFGRDLTRTIEQIADWRFGPRTEQIRILEFASGYGRNVRHLVRRFDPRNITVSDIYAEAVAFTTSQFDVNGRVSVHDPADLDWDERFDLIVVPSLFSHLPDATFGPWVRALHKLLTDDGILVFSTHGTHLRPGHEVPPSGIHFEAESESTTLDTAEYGTAHVTETYVADRIRSAVGHSSYSYTRRGFWNHQDFYIVPKHASDVSTFRYRYGPLAYLDALRLTADGHLEMSGWACDLDVPGHNPLQVRVTADDIVVATGPARNPREDVASFWGPRTLQTGFWLTCVNFSQFHSLDSTLLLETVSQAGARCFEAMPVGALLTANDLED